MPSLVIGVMYTEIILRPPATGPPKIKKSDSSHAGTRRT